MTASSHRIRDGHVGGSPPADHDGSPLATTTQAGPLDAVLTATLEKMAGQWRHGQTALAEHWLAQHPELAADPETAVRIIYEEVCLREERGEQIDSQELYRRFPQWHDALAVLLDCHRLMPAAHAPAQFPTAGQTLGEFRLLHELGRGALGRVFLATQPSLSDRPLVVKLTAQSGQEHLSLARLQHTNIVPLYLVQDFPEEHLRALCMPYLGGATLSAVLQGLASQEMALRSGQQIVDRLNALQRHGPQLQTAAGPAVSFLSRSKYVEAVCWIGACLADALQYAHQRGLVHLDIKPTNVLLAGDGQPMLLDFHLACELRQLADHTIDRLGGTHGYMSPEQSAATEAFKRGEPIPKTIDGRSDIFSLGVLLYESLAGQLPVDVPFDSKGALRRANPNVSPGLEQIIAKCLASVPADRYRDAGQLATDLRCHLANLPLRGVANRSLVERWQKWRRRKPHALPHVLATVMLATIVVGSAAVVYRERLRSAESFLSQAEHEFASGDFQTAKQRAQAALGSLHWFPWKTELIQRIQAQIEAAQHALPVSELHTLVDQLRFLDDQQLSRALAQIAQGCSQVWGERAIIAAPLIDGSEYRKSPVQEEQLRHDLLDLAILSAQLEVRLAAPESQATARQSAMGKFAEARQLCGPDPILDLIERDYSAAGNSEHVPSATKPGAAEINIHSLPVGKNAWQHYAIGRWLMHHGLLAQAERQFADAIELQPDDFWANFQLTRCHYDLSHFDRALTSATVCIALAPRRAECFYNRALCYQALGYNSEALADLAHALQLDPQLAPASISRGELLLSQQQFEAAADNFKIALAHGSPLGEVAYQLARVSLAQHNPEAARDWLQKSLADDPANSAAVALQKELTAHTP